MTIYQDSHIMYFFNFCRVVSLENDVQAGAQVIYQQYMANCYGNLQQLDALSAPELEPNVAGLEQTAVLFPPPEENHFTSSNGIPQQLQQQQQQKQQQQQQQQLGLLDLSHLATNPGLMSSVPGQNEFASVVLASHGSACDINSSSLASSLSGSSLGLLQSHPEVRGASGSWHGNGRNVKASDESAEFDSEDSTTWEFNDCTFASTGNGLSAHSASRSAMQDAISERDCSRRKRSTHSRSNANISTKQVEDVQKRHGGTNGVSKRIKDSLTHGRSHHKSKGSSHANHRSRRRGHRHRTSCDQDHGTCETMDGRSRSRHSRSASTELGEMNSHCSRMTPSATNNLDAISYYHKRSSSPLNTAGTVGKVTDTGQARTRSLPRTHHGFKESTPSSPNRQHSTAASNSANEHANLSPPKPRNENAITLSSSNRQHSTIASNSLNEHSGLTPPRPKSCDPNGSIRHSSKEATPSSPSSCYGEAVSNSFHEPCLEAGPTLAYRTYNSEVPLQLSLCGQGTCGVHNIETIAESHFDTSIPMVSEATLSESVPATEIIDSTFVAQYSDSTSTAQFSELTHATQFSESTPQFRESTPATQFSESTPQFRESTPATQFSESTPQFRESTPATQFSESTPQFRESTPATQFSESTPQFRESTPATQFSESTLQFRESTPATQFSESTPQFRESTPVTQFSESTPQFRESTPATQFSESTPQFRESTPATQFSESTPQFRESTPATQFSESTPQFRESTPATQFSESTPQFRESTPVTQFSESIPVTHLSELNTFELTPVTQSTTDTQFSEATPSSQYSELTLVNQFSDSALSTQFSESVPVTRCRSITPTSNFKPSISNDTVQQEAASSEFHLVSTDPKPARPPSSRSHRTSSRLDASSRTESSSRTEGSTRSDGVKSKDRRHHSRSQRVSIGSRSQNKDGSSSSRNKEDDLKVQPVGAHMRVCLQEGVRLHKDRSRNHGKSHSGSQHGESHMLMQLDFPGSRSQQEKPAHHVESYSRSHPEVSNSRILHGDSNSRPRHNDSISRTRHDSSSKSRRDDSYYKSRHEDSRSQHNNSFTRSQHDCSSSRLPHESSSGSRHAMSKSRSQHSESSSWLHHSESSSRLHHGKSSSRLHHSESICSSKAQADDHSRLRHRDTRSMHSELSSTSHHSKHKLESRSQHRHNISTSHRRISSPHPRCTSNLRSRTNSLQLDRLRMAGSGSRRRSLQEDRHILSQKHHMDHSSGLSPRSKRTRKDLQYSEYRHSTPDSLEGRATPSVPRSRCDDESSVVTLGSLNDPILLDCFEEEDFQTDANQLTDDDRGSLESGELLSLESGEVSLESGELNSFSSQSPVNLNSSNNCNGNNQEEIVLTKVQESGSHPVQLPPCTPPSPPPPTSAAVVVLEARKLDYSCFNFSSSDISLSESSDAQTSSNSSNQNQSASTILSRSLAVSEEMHTGGTNSDQNGARHALPGSDESVVTTAMTSDPTDLQANSPSMYLNSPKKYQQVENGTLKLGTSEEHHTCFSPCDLDSLAHQMLPSSSQQTFDPSCSSWLNVSNLVSTNATFCDRQMHMQGTVASQVTTVPVFARHDSILNGSVSTSCEDLQPQHDTASHPSGAPLCTGPPASTTTTVISQPYPPPPANKTLCHKPDPCNNPQPEVSLQRSLMERSRHFDAPISPKPLDSSITFSDSAQWISPSINSCDDLPECADSITARCKSNSSASLGTLAASRSPLVKASGGPPSAEVTILDTSNNYTDCVDMQLLDTSSYVFLSPLPASAEAQETSSSSDEDSRDGSIEEGEISDSSDSNEADSQTNFLLEDSLRSNEKIHSNTHSSASKRDYYSKYAPSSDCSYSSSKDSRYCSHKNTVKCNVPERTRTRCHDAHPKRDRHRLDRSHDCHHNHRSRDHHYGDRSRVRIK